MNPGVAYTGSGDGVPDRVYLPLEELTVKVSIVDVSAKVMVSQIYFNPLDNMTGRCKYMFPVPASAAICAFHMKTSDGRTVTGFVKEKKAAQLEYEEAVRSRQFAGLVNHATDDIFTISIGAIPPHATVEVHLEYVMILSNHDNADEVRFQLSKGIGERYGVAPAELAFARRPASETRVRITCEIQTSGRIQKIFSLSHANEIINQKYPTNKGRDSRRRSTVKYRSRTFLDRDFVLIICAEELDSPRCFCEMREDDEDRYRTIAMQLSLVPKFCMPSIPVQEYLFVVDRSSSMGGRRISTAKDTLILLLRRLPTQGSIFNVFMFNNSVDPLWRASHPYGEGTLKQATKFVDSIKEGGGTEIGLALRSVLSSRDKQMPTVVFLLTDGEAYGDDPILVVGEAVKESSTNAPLRVFTLGIGHGISTATCDGIARAGNGASLYALDTEGILGQCARLFTAGRSSFVRDVKIDWGIPRDELGVQGVSFSNQTLSAGSIPNLPPPVIQQAPTEITHIHAGTRMNIYVIISLKRGFVPKKIVLSGENESSGGSFELSIPIHLVRLTGADEGLPLIHTLAAAWLIKEHQARKAPLPIAVMPASEDDIRRAVIVRIAEKYQLVSEHTSFVAVDSGQDDPRRSRHRTRRTILRSRSHSPEVRGRNITVTPTGLFQSTLSVLSGLFGIGSNTIRDDSQTLPGSWPDSPPRSATPSDDGVDEDEEGGESEDSRETFSTLSSLESYGWSDWSRTPSPIPRWSEEDERMRNQPSPSIECNLGLPDLPLAPVGASAVPPREVVELMHLQCFDGSFKLEELRGIIGSKALDEVNNVDVDAKVWATALSVAFMRKHMGNQKEMLSDLLAKALDYLGAMAQGLVDELIAHAEHALA